MRREGFEPPAVPLEEDRSSAELPARSGPPGTRTRNTKVKSQLLCALELAARGGEDGI